MMTCEKQGRLYCWNFKGAMIDKVVVGEGVTYSAKISLCGRYIGVCGKYKDNVNVSIYNIASLQDMDGNGKIVKDKKPIWTHNKESVFSFDWSTDSSKLVALGNQDEKRRDLVFKLFDVTGELFIIIYYFLQVSPLLFVPNKGHDINVLSLFYRSSCRRGLSRLRSCHSFRGCWGRSCTGDSPFFWRLSPSRWRSLWSLHLFRADGRTPLE